MLANTELTGTPVTVLVPSSVRDLPLYEHLAVKRVGRFSGQLWEQFELPFHAKGGLLFTPCGGAPVIHPRNVVTIHDAAVVSSPQGYSLAFRTWYRFLNWVLCHSALHIFTVSKFSKQELIKWYGARADKTTVTYLGSDHALRPASDPSILGRNQLDRFRYVLLVASRNPNKNIAGLLHALPHLAGSGLQIAIAGYRDEKVFGGDHKSTGSSARDLGYVDESELRTLYENAACFVFPSFYEGFGLPPLEALALGCPVVVSNAGSLPEVFGGIALICRPDDPPDIAHKLLMAAKATPDDRLRNRAFAADFKWADCALATWKVLFEKSAA
ncbi:glycosyltransferase family 4 protein [Granulicella arctica]|uniref:glycosyltransferase family 4 protein n=1 Tax=Granulicella arctica TaxID=940613 RepID=UPI0021E0A2D5|nr:glycosyltransferase family 1 protein [Granulicella arctica]